jgi:predicted PolB exonuclease-like 3'-5' exonuclease
MIPFASFDAETIPRQDLPDGCRPVFDESSVALGNMTDPIKIAAKIQKARAQFEAQESKRFSTHPDRCQICAFVGYESSSDTYLEIFAKDLGEERQLLNEAWKWIARQVNEKATLVTFNGKSFDLPVLYRRAMIRDVRTIQKTQYDRITGRYTQDLAHLDLMLALGNPTLFSSRPEVESFEYYLSLFGLGAKPEGWHGGRVFEAFKEGAFEDILLYCRWDVELLNALFLRASPWLLDIPAEPVTTDQAA